MRLKTSFILLIVFLFLPIYSLSASELDSDEPDTEDVQDSDNEDLEEPEMGTTNQLDVQSGSGFTDESDYTGLQNRPNTNLDLPTGEDLTVAERVSISFWLKDIKDKNRDEYSQYVRVGFLVAGILIILWALFLYLGYWLDRFFNFLDISFLYVLSFGNLTVSASEGESTYNPNNSDKVKLVNHKNIVVICMSLLVLGFLVISGLLYSGVTFIINLLRARLAG